MPPVASYDCLVASLTARRAVQTAQLRHPLSDEPPSAFSAVRPELNELNESQLVYGSESNLDRPPSDMGTVQSRGCDRPTGFCFQLCSLVSPHFDWGVCQ